MNDRGNGKPRNGKPLAILDLHGKPINAGSDMSGAKPRISPRISTSYMKSDCCSMPTLIGIRSNGEIITVCMRCKKYIGHMTPKPYAILYQGIAGSITKAMKKRNCNVNISIEQLGEVIKEHLKFLVEKSEEFFDDLIDKLINGAEGGDDSAEGGDTDKSGGQTDDSKGSSDVPKPGNKDDPEDDQQG